MEISLERDLYVSFGASFLKGKKGSETTSDLASFLKLDNAFARF